MRENRPHGSEGGEGESPSRPLLDSGGIARSTLYDEPRAAIDDTAIVEAMFGICEEFERYGWRRVRAALRQQGMVVNHKKVRRLMREHDLQPRMHRRYTTTTDSDHRHRRYHAKAADPGQRPTARWPSLGRIARLIKTDTLG